MISTGDTLPDVTFDSTRVGKPEPLKSGEFFSGKRVLLTAVPGAFTPTCSVQHLPGYIERIEEFRRRGITVAFVSVNDAFVMDAWGKSQRAPGEFRVSAADAVLAALPA